MKKLARRIFPSLAFAFAFAATSATAQEYPTKPITIVVPFAAGGAMDTTARLMAEHLKNKLGRAVIVDNKAGGSGTIGTLAVAHAQADGYTLLFTNQGPNVVRELLYPDTRYKMTSDFTGVSMLSSSPLVAVVSKDSTINAMTDLLRMGKDRSTKLNFGSTGVGSPAHIAAEGLNMAAGINLAHIPYGGASRIVAALLGNEVQLAFLAPSDALPQVAAGKLRAIAVTTDQRFALAPGVPTLKEAGIKEGSFDMWYSLMVPAATPRPVIAKLNAAVVAVLHQPNVKERLAKMGFEPQPSAPEQVMTRLQSDRVLFQQIITKANIKPE